MIDVGSAGQSAGLECRLLNNRTRELQPHLRNLRKISLPIHRNGRFNDGLFNVETQRQDSNPGMMRLAINQRQKVRLAVAGASVFLLRLLVPETKRRSGGASQFSNSDTTPRPECERAPLPGFQPFEVSASDKEYSNATFTDHPPILARKRPSAIDRAEKGDDARLPATLLTTSLTISKPGVPSVARMGSTKVACSARCRISLRSATLSRS